MRAMSQKATRSTPTPRFRLTPGGRRLGTAEGPKVSEAFTPGHFDTVLGKITFDAKGDPNTEPFILYAWKDGKYATN